MDVDAQSGNKRTRAVEEEEDPVTAAQARKKENLRKIRQKKKAANMSQSKNSFVAVTDGIPRSPPTKRRDKATARKSAAARSQPMTN